MMIFVRKVAKEGRFFLFVLFGSRRLGRRRLFFLMTVIGEIWC